jgi:hypothetical protein
MSHQKGTEHEERKNVPSKVKNVRCARGGGEGGHPSETVKLYIFEHQFLKYQPNKY